MTNDISATTSELNHVLYHVHEQIRRLEYPEANAALEEAIRVASDGHPDMEEGRLLLAETSLVIGRWERSQRELERLLETTQVAERKVRAHLGMGELLSSRGEPDEAREHFGKAVQEAESADLGRWAIASCVRLAGLAGQTGEMDTYRSLLEKAEARCREFQDDPEWAELNAALDTQWGLYFFRLSQRPQAEERLTRALDNLRNGLNSSLEEPTILRYLGVMASLRRDYRLALEYHLEALTLYTRAGHKFGQAKVYDSIGRTLQGANRLDEAIFTFKKSESLCRRLGANAELATLYGKLGQVAMLREDTEGAIRYFQKDLELSSRYRNYYALGYSYRNLGRCLMQVGRHEEAIINLKESIGLFQYVEDWINLARVFMDLGFAHAKAGQVAEAKEVAQRASSLFSEHSLITEKSFLGCLDGMISRLEGNLEKAEFQFKDCIAQLQDKSARVWLGESYYELGLLYRDQNHKPKATEAFKSAARTARGAGLARQVGRYLQELESLNEIELFHVWMEDLPEGGGPDYPSGEP